jgi:hypothetical protein
MSERCVEAYASPLTASKENFKPYFFSSTFGGAPNAAFGVNREISGHNDPPDRLL